MPYINTKTTVSITPEKEAALKEKLGKAISLLPGKSEQWLMLSFEDCCRMLFQGCNGKPLAFAEVKLFGKASAADYEALTGRITEILGEELGIAPAGIYVKYEEVSHWGWNGGNF